MGWRAVGERLACDMAENRNHPPSPENTVLNMLNVVKRVNPTNPPSPRRAGQREEPAARTGPMTPCTCTKIKNKKLYDTKGGYEAQRTYSTRTPVRALFKTGILFFRFFFAENRGAENLQHGYAAESKRRLNQSKETYYSVREEPAARERRRATNKEAGVMPRALHRALDRSICSTFCRSPCRSLCRVAGVMPRAIPEGERACLGFRV